MAAQAGARDRSLPLQRYISHTTQSNRGDGRFAGNDQRETIDGVREHGPRIRRCRLGDGWKADELSFSSTTCDQIASSCNIFQFYEKRFASGNHVSLKIVRSVMKEDVDPGLKKR